MKSELRASGIDIVGSIPWGTHFCQFYETRRDLIAIVAPYFKSGLENSEFCIWITPETLGLEEAKQVLRKSIPDFEAYFQKGQIEIVSYADWYEKTYISDFNKSLKAWIEKVSQEDANAYEGLRLSGDSTWSEHYRKDIIYYESEMDCVISKYKIISLCTYFLETCNIARVAEIAANHKFTLAKHEGKWEKIENSGRIRAEKAEIKLKGAYESLEEKVRARTAELENANKSLKENERRFAEAQKMAHIGSWDWDLLTGEVCWSEELYRIFGLIPQKTGLTYDEFLNYLHPKDKERVNNSVRTAFTGALYETDFSIILPSGAERIVHAQGKVIFDKKNTPILMRGTVQDITERKEAEKALEKIQEMHIKEIHHRIKNNLQVISSLLSLQAEKFNDLKILEAFKESQNRVASMALIHEELYKGNTVEKLNFAAYIRKLSVNLFHSYILGNNVSLKLNLEQVFLGMDAAIPLGIIINELISNALKHAFPEGLKGEICINLYKTEDLACACEISREISGPKNKGNFNFMLRVADNGKGIPEEIRFEEAESLGFQLVSLLIDQIDGYMELKRDNGTEFVIWFNDVEISEPDL